MGGEGLTGGEIHLNWHKSWERKSSSTINDDFIPPIELFSKSTLQSHQKVLQRGVLHPGKTICSRVRLIFFINWVPFSPTHIRILLIKSAPFIMTPQNQGHGPGLVLTTERYNRSKTHVYTTHVHTHTRRSRVKNPFVKLREFEPSCFEDSGSISWEKSH